MYAQDCGRIGKADRAHKSPVGERRGEHFQALQNMFPFVYPEK